MRSGTPITTALREHYQQTGGATRFRDFRVKRLNTSQTTSEDAAHHMLTSTDVPIINLGRSILEQQRGGLDMVLSHLLPDDMLREFRLGFAATLTAHAGLEASSQAKMKSNHARLFTDGKA